MSKAESTIRYVYIVVVALVTLNLVVVTLAAYRFQSSLRVQVAGETDETPGEKVLEELREWRGKVVAAQELRDQRETTFSEAIDLLPNASHPALFEALDKDRRMRASWLRTVLPARDPPGFGTAQASDAPNPVTARADALAVAAYNDLLQSEIEFKAVKEALPKDLVDRAQALAYFEYIGFIVSPLMEPIAFAVMPDWLLTLVVVTSMGALGSLLYVTKDFLGEQIKSVEVGVSDKLARPLAWFLLRPLLGIVTAFAVFVFLQAGLALTDGALGKGSDIINPYFVGIVSGLLSLQAIERIERWGKRFFGDDNVARWAYGLKETLQLQAGADPSKTKEQLATLLKVSEAQIDDWENQKTRVPQDTQRRIADWLRTDPRHIFSELAVSG